MLSRWTRIRYGSLNRNGPTGAVYTATKSGWFEAWSFADWFKKVFLPVARRLPGKKVLVGDNLSSHISVEVIDLCGQHDIEFVCLPPNATHLMQPLDVGLFAPMKQAWRNQLQQYSAKDPTAKLLQKSEFPRMLKELISVLNPQEVMPNAFERCGLFPLDPVKVTERIPTILSTQEVARSVDSVLLKTLETRRFGGKKAVPRGKKVPAGKSYTAGRESSEEESPEELSESENDPDEPGIDPEDSEELPELSATGLLRPGRNLPVQTSEEPYTDTPQGEAVTPGLAVHPEGDETEAQPASSRMSSNCLVVAVYEGEWFVAEKLPEQSRIPKSYTRLSYATLKGKNCFSWAAKRPDIFLTLNEDILLENITVVPLNSRGQFGLRKNDLKKVESLMVVVYLIFEIKFFYLLPIFINTVLRINEVQY